MGLEDLWVYGCDIPEELPVDQPGDGQTKTAWRHRANENAHSELPDPEPITKPFV